MCLLASASVSQLEPSARVGRSALDLLSGSEARVVRYDLGMPLVNTEDLKPSMTALSAFRAEIEKHNIWDGARAALVGLRLNGSFVLFLLRVTLKTQGATLPDERDFFAAKTSEVLVAPIDLDLPDLWAVLEELTRGCAERLSALVGEPLVVHESCGGQHWYGHTERYSNPTGVIIQIAKGGRQGFSEIFGHPAFETIQTSLRNNEEPYGSLSEIARAMNFSSSVGEISNNARPQFEIGAQLPLSLESVAYKPREKGIVVEVRAGATVPRDRIRISVMPSPRRLVRGTECAAIRKGDFWTLRYVLPCSRPEREVVVSLQFDDLRFGESKIAAPQSALRLLIGRDPVQQWEMELRAEFGMTPKELEALIARSIPKKAGSALKVARDRIRDAVVLRKEFPFYAIVAAGSVAEFVLKEHLRRVHPADLDAAAPVVGVKLAKGRARWRMGFDDAAKLADHLGLLKKLDKSAVDVLRSARNHVHFNREHPFEARQFSGARAMASIVVMLDLLGRPPQKKRGPSAPPVPPTP